MDYQQLLKQRRSVRNFQDRELPIDLVNELIREATMAPSAGNSQPWEFIIVRDRAMMKRMSDESIKNLLAFIEANPDHYVARYRKMLQKEGYNVYYNAPALVMIVGKADYKNLLVDCALAASYLMMSAADRGLGSCWINLGMFIQDEAMLDELGLKSEHQIVAPIILGYPASIPSAPKRQEPKVLKVIF